MIDKETTINCLVMIALNSCHDPYQFYVSNLEWTRKFLMFLFLLNAVPDVLNLLLFTLLYVDYTNRVYIHIFYTLILMYSFLSLKSFPNFKDGLCLRPYEQGVYQSDLFHYSYI